MKFCVYYWDFLWDNYQGGQGKYVDCSYVIEVEDSLPLANLEHEIYERLRHHVVRSRVFNQGNESARIYRIELLLEAK